VGQQFKNDLTCKINIYRFFLFKGFGKGVGQNRFDQYSRENLLSAIWEFPSEDNFLFHYIFSLVYPFLFLKYFSPSLSFGLHPYVRIFQYENFHLQVTAPCKTLKRKSRPFGTAPSIYKLRSNYL